MPSRAMNTRMRRSTPSATATTSNVSPISPSSVIAPSAPTARDAPPTVTFASGGCTRTVTEWRAGALAVAGTTTDATGGGDAPVAVERDHHAAAPITATAAAAASSVNRRGRSLAVDTFETLGVALDENAAGARDATFDRASIVNAHSSERVTG